MKNWQISKQKQQEEENIKIKKREQLKLALKNQEILEIRNSIIFCFSWN